MTTKPNLRLNGTAPRELLKQQMEAMSALLCARRVIEEAAPKSCDYPLGTFQAAQDEHQERLRRIALTVRELDAIAQHIANTI